ncbi:hypothetical protein PM082_018173 [Marasmius tenuissimus]|nr:hypothetical protein PM082_018173 [Marasmius tenuissimus]
MPTSNDNKGRNKAKITEVNAGVQASTGDSDRELNSDVPTELDESDVPPLMDITEDDYLLRFTSILINKRPYRHLSLPNSPLPYHLSHPFKTSL